MLNQRPFLCANQQQRRTARCADGPVVAGSSGLAADQLTRAGAMSGYLHARVCAFLKTCVWGLIRLQPEEGVVLCGKTDSTPDVRSAKKKRRA